MTGIYGRSYTLNAEDKRDLERAAEAILEYFRFDMARHESDMSRELETYMNDRNVDVDRNMCRQAVQNAVDKLSELIERLQAKKKQKSPDIDDEEIEYHLKKAKSKFNHGNKQWYEKQVAKLLFLEWSKWATLQMIEDRVAEFFTTYDKTLQDFDHETELILESNAKMILEYFEFNMPEQRDTMVHHLYERMKGFEGMTPKFCGQMLDRVFANMDDVKRQIAAKEEMPKTKIPDDVISSLLDEIEQYFHLSVDNPTYKDKVREELVRILFMKYFFHFSYTLGEIKKRVDRFLKKLGFFHDHDEDEDDDEDKAKPLPIAKRPKRDVHSDKGKLERKIDSFAKELKLKLEDEAQMVFEYFGCDLERKRDMSKLLHLRMKDHHDDITSKLCYVMLERIAGNSHKIKKEIAYRKLKMKEDIEDGVIHALYTKIGRGIKSDAECEEELVKTLFFAYYRKGYTLDEIEERIDLYRTQKIDRNLRRKLKKDAKMVSEYFAFDLPNREDEMVELLHSLWVENSDVTPEMCEQMLREVVDTQDVVKEEIQAKMEMEKEPIEDIIIETHLQKLDRTSDLNHAEKVDRLRLELFLEYYNDHYTWPEIVDRVSAYLIKTTDPLHQKLEKDAKMILEFAQFDMEDCTPEMANLLHSRWKKDGSVTPELCERILLRVYAGKDELKRLIKQKKKMEKRHIEDDEFQRKLAVTHWNVRHLRIISLIDYLTLRETFFEYYDENYTFSEIKKRFADFVGHFGRAVIEPYNKTDKFYIIEVEE